jgi:RNA polymerase sigma-70 factor, ECF subfamily
MPPHRGQPRLARVVRWQLRARPEDPVLTRLRELRYTMLTVFDSLRVFEAVDPLGSGDQFGIGMRAALVGVGRTPAARGVLGPVALGVDIAAATETPDGTAAQAPPRPSAGSGPYSDDDSTDVGQDWNGWDENNDEDGTHDGESRMPGILSRAQAGDPEAFGTLYDRYADLIYRYTYYRVGNRALAEDLTSETFTRALRRITSFTWQGRDFGAWLVTIARNLIADHYKSARFRLELPTADLLGAGADRPAAGPEGQVLDSLTNAALLDAVRQLGAEQQECVVLRFLEGLSVAETALAMGKKPGAIKAMQYRAVRSLEKLLPAGLAP